MSFFNSLSVERKEILISKLEVKNTEGSIENFAKYLYNLRSKFVHEAELIHQVSNNTWVGHNKKNMVTCKLSIIDTMRFFEEGLIIWGTEKI